MRHWVFLFLIFIFSVLEATLLDAFKIFNVKPNLLLIAVVIASLDFNLKWALILSIFCGVLKDVLGLNLLGINTFLFPLWSFLIIKLSKKISIDNNFLCVILVSIIVIFNSLITQLIFFYSGRAIVSFWVLVYKTILESLYAALVLPLIFKVVRLLAYPASWHRRRF